MRKTLIVLLSLALLLLAACSQTPATAPVTSAPPDSLAPTEASATAPLPAPGASPTSPSGDTPEPEREVIDPGNAAEMQQVAGMDPGETTEFSWLPEGQGMVLATGGDVSVVEVETQTVTESVTTISPTLLTVSTVENMTAWADQESALHVWSASQGQEVTSTQLTTATITAIAISPDGSEIAAAGYDNSLSLVDAASGVISETFRLPAWLSDLNYSPDGAFLAGVDSPNFSVHFILPATGEIVHSLSWNETGSPVLYGAYLSPDWSTLAWVARGTVQFMDVASGAPGPVLAHEDFVSDLAWSPDGSLVATAAGGTFEGNFAPLVFLWDAATGQTVNTLVLPVPATSLDFSPDGRELAVLLSDGVIQIWAVTP